MNGTLVGEFAGDVKGTRIRMDERAAAHADTPMTGRRPATSCGVRNQ
jgi:hypothetical protein